MAQEFLRKLLPQAEVFSRGFYADPSYQVPEKIKQVLAAHQIAFTGHRSTPLTPADLQRADFIFCMEKQHEERLLDRYPQYTDKIWLLAEFAWGKDGLQGGGDTPQDEVIKRTQAIIEQHQLTGETAVLNNSGEKIANIIVREAQERNCDLIIMGTHGLTGLMHLLMGSVAEGVLRQSKIPVMLIRHA